MYEKMMPALRVECGQVVDALLGLLRAVVDDDVHLVLMELFRTFGEFLEVLLVVLHLLIDHGTELIVHVDNRKVQVRLLLIQLNQPVPHFHFLTFDELFERLLAALIMRVIGVRHGSCLSYDDIYII